MKLIVFFFLIAFCAACLSSSAQSHVTNKIRTEGQLPTSFYGKTFFDNDVKLRLDAKNDAAKMTQDLKNPPGTIVLDAGLSTDAEKDILSKSDEIVFTQDHANIPIRNGNVTYRIPVDNISKHHALNAPFVETELKEFVNESVGKYKIVPSYIRVEHLDDLASGGKSGCYFLTYSSQSGLYPGPYDQYRLNLGCGAIKDMVSRFWLYYAKL